MITRFLGVLAMCLAVSCPAFAQGEFGYGICCPPSPAPCGIIPCDTQCAGPAIQGMGTDFFAEVIRTIEQPSALTPFGSTGLKPYADRWLSGLSGLNVTFETALNNLMRAEALGQATLMEQWDISSREQVLVESEFQRDSDFGPTGEGLDCNCGERENVALDVRTAEAAIRDLDAFAAEKHAQANHDKQDRVARSGRSKAIRALLSALDDGPALRPVTGDISPEESNALLNVAVALANGEHYANGDTERQKVISSQLRDVGMRAIVQYYGRRTAEDGSRSIDSVLVDGATKRILVDSTAGEVRSGSPRWLAAESVFLDAEAAALEQRLEDARRVQSITMAAAVMRNVKQ